MSSQGRCAGCGETGPLKAVVLHVLTCQDWARLYRDDPGRALMPAEEYARWYAEDRAGEKSADLQRRVDDTVQRRAAMSARFTARDPLED
jgi:hypothetical protein